MRKRVSAEHVTFSSLTCTAYICRSQAEDNVHMLCTAFCVCSFSGVLDGMVRHPTFSCADELRPGKKKKKLIYEGLRQKWLPWRREHFQIHF